MATIFLFCFLAFLIGGAGGFIIQRAPGNWRIPVLLVWITAPLVILEGVAFLSGWENNQTFGQWMWLAVLIFAFIPFAVWAGGSVAGFMIRIGRRPG